MGAVKRCLAKRPTERFQTVAELSHALRAVASNPAEQKPSIAVLPFADMSPGKDQEYFSDGLGEEIISTLAHAGSQGDCADFGVCIQGQNLDVRRIAEVFGVTNILEGSVRKAGNRIRVTALRSGAGGRLRGAG
jgi:eukaryotic-like serine/threonine-protein kinase